MKQENIARVCHEVNRAYCVALGDDSQVAWDDAEDWQKESALMGVKLHIDNPEAGPEASHVSWSAQKVADGWVYGEEKDAEKKTHPCLVPFEELSVEQQAKDYIFATIVKAIHSTKEDIQVDQDKTPVQYIGRRETYSDGLFDTGDWVKGQTKIVDGAVAKKMLAHPDVYIRGVADESTEKVEITGPSGDDAPNLEAGREAVMGLRSKKAVIEWVSDKFSGAQLQLSDKATVADARLEAIRMIDMYHLPE